MKAVHFLYSRRIFQTSEEIIEEETVVFIVTHKALKTPTSFLRLKLHLTTTLIEKPFFSIPPFYRK